MMNCCTPAPYALAHDCTPCSQSKKTWDPVRRQVNDTFEINCLGGTYSQNLRFNTTDTKGSLAGWWGNKAGITPQHGWIPDTIVDFELNADGTGYDWVSTWLKSHALFLLAA